MRMIFAVPLLAIGLASCQTYRSATNDQGPMGISAAQSNYRAIGTEPFWDLTIGRNIVFTDRGSNVQVAEPTPRVRTGVAVEIYQGRWLNVNIVHSRCSDGMSNRSYPDSVNVMVDGRAYRGCGANAAFFDQAGENGDAVRSPITAINISGEWTAVAFDGRPAIPAEHFPLTITATELTARLCNDVRGTYRIAGSRIVPVEPWPRSERGCDDPQMRLEDRAWAVLGASPMVAMPVPGRMRLTSARGSIDFVRTR